MKEIDELRPETGRLYREDDTILNIADSIANATDPSGGIKVLNEIQSAIHAGHAYVVSAHGVGLADSGTVQFLGRIGSKQVHFYGFDVTVSQSPVLVEFFEAPTVTSPGTAVTTVNKDRGSASTALTLVYSTPTISADGTPLDSQLIPQVSQGSGINPGGTSIGEWVLEANTDYYFRVTNQSGVAINYNINFVFHEESYIV